jgi:prepilin-type N-terminal cleavage/methylation domain-containing protein
MMKNQSGFSLLETLVAAGIVALIAYYVVGAVNDTLNDSRGLNNSLLANQLVQERISKMKSLSGYYVPLVNSADVEGMYVSCINRQGMSQEQGNGELVVFGKTFGKPSLACPATEIEVQFQASRTDSAILESRVIVYRKRDHVNYTVHDRKLRLEKTL